MKKALRFALAVAVALVTSQVVGSAQADPIFGPGLNTIQMDNREIQYRPSANCTAANPCFDFRPGRDPVGYREATPTGNNVIPGDVFVGILNVTSISSATTTWTTAPTDQFSGYFSAQVASVNPPPDPWDQAQTTLDHVVLTTPVGGSGDPFGILAAGEVIRLFVDAGGGATVFTTNSATPSGDITNATNGVLWGSLGAGTVGPTPPAAGCPAATPDCGVDTDGYIYTHADVAQSLLQFSGTNFLGLNVVVDGLAPDFNRINAIQENEVGVVSSFTPGSGLCFNPDTVTGLAVACTDIVGDQIVTPNNASDNPVIGGNEVWTFSTGDVAFVNVRVPEPAAIVLVGLGLLGLAGWGRLLRRIER